MEIDKIYCEDCLETMKRMEDNSIDLVVTSPPYNKGYYNPKNVSKNVKWTNRNIDYDVYSDNLKPTDYEKWQKKVIAECIRILKPTGSLFYNHKDIIHKGLIVPPKWVYDFNVKQQIIWDRVSSPMIDLHYFVPGHEWIYWLVKDPNKTYFDRSKSIFKTNIWRMSPDKNPHPAPFPEKLVGNCISTSCPMGGVVYDPFMGSGTTALMAMELDRHYIGSEISESYVEYAEKRIKSKKIQPTLF